jgi:hypothetical protein
MMAALTQAVDLIWWTTVFTTLTFNRIPGTSACSAAWGQVLPFATSASGQSHRAQHMEQTAKTQPSRLTPTPKALQKALEKSASQAQ